MMKKFMIFFMVLILSLGLIGCKPKEPIDDPVVEPPVEEPVEDEDPIPNADSVEVNLYFANDEYIQTGDESLEKLIPEVRTFDAKDILLEETMVKALMEKPESQGLRTGIPNTAKLLGVKVVDKTAYVDFAQEGMNGGSLEETFTINQIVASLVELDTVDRVQFLLDGEKGDSLMGHYSIQDPFETTVD